MLEAWTKDIMEAVDESKNSGSNEWDDLFPDLEEDLIFD